MMVTVVLLLSLGIDTFAVALSLGLAGLPRSRWWTVGAVFACFEGGMPIAGLLLGRQVSVWAGAAAPYLGGAVLLILGLLALREALGETEDEPESDAPSEPAVPGVGPADGEDQHDPVLPKFRGTALLLTGLSVSIDELAVGFSLGVFRSAIALAALYLALQAFAATFLGLSAGRRLGKRFQERAELAAGILLTLLGLFVLVEAATGAKLL